MQITVEKPAIYQAANKPVHAMWDAVYWWLHFTSGIDWIPSLKAFNNCPVCRSNQVNKGSGTAGMVTPPPPFPAPPSQLFVLLPLLKILKILGN